MEAYAIVDDTISSKLYRTHAEAMLEVAVSRHERIVDKPVLCTGVIYKTEQ